MPFREAHGVVGGLVRAAVESGRSLSELDPEELATIRAARDEYYEVLREGAWLDSKLSPAGPPPRAWRSNSRRRDGRSRRTGRGRVSALGPEFFDRSVHEVARDLIGCELLVDGVGGRDRRDRGLRASEPACHAYVGPTARNGALFGPPGRAYVYLSYGIHSC